MKNSPSALMLFAALLCGVCQAGQTWEPASISLRKIVRAVPVIAIVSPELPEPEDQDLEEDPDSLPPIPFK
jgi:hypothetical protein